MFLSKLFGDGSVKLTKHYNEFFKKEVGPLGVGKHLLGPFDIDIEVNYSKRNLKLYVVKNKKRLFRFGDTDGWKSDIISLKFSGGAGLMYNFVITGDFENGSMAK